MIRSLPSPSIIRFVLAPILSLWIAGAGCMIGCEGMIAAAVAVPSSSQENHSDHNSARKAAIIASGYACSSSGSHSCCEKNYAETKPKARRTSTADTTLIKSDRPSSGMMEGCPLALGRAALAAKVRKNEVSATAALTHSALPAESFLEQIAPIPTPHRLPNRGHTYLRCCVFLI